MSAKKAATKKAPTTKPPKATPEQPPAPAAPKDWSGKTPTADEWREILEKHARWARGEAEGQRADLRGAYLRGADLRGAYLQGAYPQGADLRGAYLQGAYLQGADLRGADLRGADLRGADLQGADLQGADLRGADLQGADLQGAKDADLVIARTRILPEGDLIGWKKCEANVIVKLRIPADARRSHAFGRKCRAEFADVLEVIGAAEGVSLHNSAVKYRAGERVTPDGWNENWMEECSRGIHFYITRAEAAAHQ